MSNEVNEEFVYNLSKMLNIPVSEVVQKLGYVEMVGNPFWKAEDDRRSASPEPAAPAAPKGGDQRLSPEPKAAAAPAPTRMPTGGAPDRSTPNPMITEGDRELGGMGANAASGGVGAQGQRDGSWRGQTPEINLPGRVADNQYANQAGDGSFAGAARGVGGPPELRNVDSDYDAGYGAQGVDDFKQQIRDRVPRPQPQAPRSGGGAPSAPIIPTSPYETTDSPPEMMGPPSNGEEARVEGVPYSDETGNMTNWRGNTNISGPGTNGRGLPPPPPSGSLRNISGPGPSPRPSPTPSPTPSPSGSLRDINPRDAETGVLYSRKDFDAINGRNSLFSRKSYSAIFNNNDPEAMLKKLAEITGVRQDDIVKKLGNANFSENPFFDKDPRY
jgi:hypothetical protein